MTARDPDDDVEISRCTAQLRSYIAGLEHDLARSRELRTQAIASAGDAITDRELAYLERDAVARELAAALAKLELPREPSILAHRALGLWSPIPQMGQAIEEMAELIVAIRHRLRGRVEGDAMANEIADVEFMMEQMAILVRRYSGTDDTMADARKRKRAKVEAMIVAGERRRDEGATP